jgi:hypothetical protein
MHPEMFLLTKENNKFWPGMNLSGNWEIFCPEMRFSYRSSDVQNKSIRFMQEQYTACHKISNDEGERSEKGKSWVTKAIAKMLVI